jgi:hypothetical protein
MPRRSELELAFNDNGFKAEAAETMRSVIDRVVLTPAAGSPECIDAQLHGDRRACWR